MTKAYDRTIFIENLSKTVSKEEIWNFFSKYIEQIANIHIACNKAYHSCHKIHIDCEINERRRFGFIEFKEITPAQNAVKEMHEKIFGGRQIRVYEARHIFTTKPNVLNYKTQTKIDWPRSKFESYVSPKRSYITEITEIMEE
uniref:RRM domain-containing protein n=1 Tax=Acrobeloides nanus TaxID=290746 RepID=A0A914EFZ8_9BILA